MQRKIVSSSNINSIGYDKDHNMLEIEFSSGDIYQYLNIPINIFDLLMASSSKGSFFSQNIKNNFSFRKI